VRRTISVVFALTLATTVARAQVPVARLASAAHEQGRPLFAGKDGRVPVLLHLPDGMSAAALGVLEVAPGIGMRRVPGDELSAFVATNHDLHPWVSPPLRALLDKSGVLTRAAEAHALMPGVTGKGAIVGVVDTGLDITHPDLRNPDGTTRIAWLLDLSAQAYGKHADLETKFGCNDPMYGPCAVLGEAEINAFLSSKGNIPRDVIGHGTHAAGIAAGNGGGTKYVGVAPEATLIGVRVTRDSGDGSITDGDILNAVGFVFNRADSMGLPAVVNVSLGGDFGPHDGTSPLELGLSRLVGADKPGHAIVTAAGNSAGLIIDGTATYGAHTEARSVRGARTRVVLKSPIAGQTMSGSAYVWINFRGNDDVSVGLSVNGEVQLDPFASGEQGAKNATATLPYLAVINGVTDATSPINVGTKAAVVVVDGTWPSGTEFGIDLEGDGTAELWVQGSGDAEFGSAVGGSLFLGATKQGTINVPASAPGLIAVGCTINRLSWPDGAGNDISIRSVGADSQPLADSSCYFSAAGPNADGVPKPELSAPGAFVASSMSVDADPAKNPNSVFAAPPGRCPDNDPRCYVVDPHHAIASGTSFSAPQVTGAIALLFSQSPKLSQPDVLALLQGGARKFQGKVPYEWQVGPGALDVMGALAALHEKGSPSAIEPSSAESWVEISTGYVRPDPTWPVTVTVQMRAADKTPADGFESQRVTLAVENAIAKSPLHRVGPGLWQATIVGAKGSGGKNARFVASLDGVPFADRTLPVATDTWATHGSAEAGGGCAVASSSPSYGASPLAALALGLLTAARRRASRREARTALRRCETDDRSRSRRR
jgi:subtilisin family serine protease